MIIKLFIEVKIMKIYILVIGGKCYFDCKKIFIKRGNVYLMLKSINYKL